MRGFSRLKLAMAVFHVLLAHVFQTNVEAEFAHRGHIYAKFNGSATVPICHMSAEHFAREAMAEGPLYVKASDGVGVV